MYKFNNSNIIKLLVLFFFFIYLNTIYSQVVYEPLDHDIYNFLSRISQKGIIEFDDLIRPLTREYIAEKLIKTDSLSIQLTSLEREELKYFLSDYNLELLLRDGNTKSTSNSVFFNSDSFGRWRVFSYESNAFKINLSPIFGFKIGTLENAKITHVWNGIYTYGYISDVLGFSFDFRDNLETGDKIDKTKIFTPITGVNARSDITETPYPADKMEYSEARMSLGFNWTWGSFAIGKDFIEWGYGENGLIVLSHKAPSFPLIRLDVSPVDWLSFNYFHAWLSSEVIDTANIYFTSTNRPSFSFIEKYFASHSINLRLHPGLNLAFGESIIYSDKLEILYLIPITFFKAADHYLSNLDNGAGGNTQFFASLSSKGNIKNTHLYGTLFIDEITVNGLFNSSKQRNQIAYTIGSTLTDLPIENLTTKIEYSKIYPFVYQHFDNTTTYESSSYLLGHWMGNNSDQFYGSVKYRFLRGLESLFWFRYIRQGEQANIEGQFEQPQPPFLFGLRTTHTYLGLQVKYELLNEITFKARYEFISTSEQKEDLNYYNHDMNELYLSIYYGL